MEILFELIFSLIFEGSLELGSSRRIPIAVRVIALVIFSAAMLAMIGLITLPTAAFVQSGQYLLAAFFGAIDVLFLWFFIKAIRKAIRSRS